MKIYGQVKPYKKSNDQSKSTDSEEFIKVGKFQKNMKIEDDPDMVMTKEHRKLQELNRIAVILAGIK